MVQAEAEDLFRQLTGDEKLSSKLDTTMKLSSEGRAQVSIYVKTGLMMISEVQSIIDYARSVGNAFSFEFRERKMVIR